MEAHLDRKRSHNGPLILVPHNDTIRLLEVYVKRSLSLNDGTVGYKKAVMKEKWVTKKERRHSSDPSLHLDEGLNDSGTLFVVEPPTLQPVTHPEESEKRKEKQKKNKKPSFWKTFFGFFSRKNNEDKDEEQDCPSEMPKMIKKEEEKEEEASETMTTCLPTTPATLQKKTSLRKRSIKRRRSRLSLIKPSKPGRDINPAVITGVEAVVSVEPTYSYYEKVSEELEKIIHEVKVKEEVQTLSDEEVINRIIALTKEQGDLIDDKLKDNPALNNFFQRISYSSFQKLADAYLEKEMTPTHGPPTVPSTAPELVKLAFALDFTARIAGLSKPNICRITGLGNRYLQDCFEYKQAITDHPDTDD